MAEDYTRAGQKKGKTTFNHTKCPALCLVIVKVFTLYDARAYVINNININLII